MSTRHALGYSKSTRARCHGPKPCQGSYLEAGTLRYGCTQPGEFEEKVLWRHWGCVTPDILAQLASAPITQVEGFDALRPTDQQKVRLAVSTRQINPVDIPPSARGRAQPSNSAPSTKVAAPIASTSQKRKMPPGSGTGFVANDTENSEPEPVDEVYCSLTFGVAGVQYYTGLVGPGEAVKILREYNNKYDSNAIQVQNIGGVQVGHLPRQHAAKLAPLLDRKLVTLEGIMKEGNLVNRGKKIYSLSMELRIFGPSNKRAELEPMLVWATPGQRGFPPRPTVQPSQSGPSYTGNNHSASMAGPSSAAPSYKYPGGSSQRPSGPTAAQLEASRKRQEAIQKAFELRETLAKLEKVDDEGRRSSLLDSLCGAEDILTIPSHPNPPGIRTGELTVDLLKHQSQALQWCIERENPVLPTRESDKPTQFWQIKSDGKKPYYFNIVTKSPQESRPELGRGALCADAMGLGKTLTMLALILTTKRDQVANDSYSKGTLIVAPLSVISNWQKQIEDHCAPNALSSCFYYGTSRTMSAQELRQYDVVITTYQVISGQHISTESGGEPPASKKKKVESSLFDLPWKRIILDEGHTIRNPATKTAQAIYALTAERRWVLSGTPIINSPRDLGSILTFLRICRPLDQPDFFKRLLLRPLKDGDPAGAELLRALMTHICIRRTKEMQDSTGKALIALPPVEMIIVPVALSDDVRKMYDEVEKLSQKRLEYYLAQTAGTMAQSNVLSLLTRMRQLVLHPELLPSNYLEELRATVLEEPNSSAPASLNPEDKLRLQALLTKAIEDYEECPICFSHLADARITACAHAFCTSCIKEAIDRDPTCPMDRRPISFANLLEPLPPTELTQVSFHRGLEQKLPSSGPRSSKVEQLVHLLKLTPSTEKSLVFSQFTSFLDKIADAFDEEGISYVRFDGQMSAKRREETIRRFSVPINEELEETSSLLRSRRTRGGKQKVIDDLDFADDNRDNEFLVDEDDDFQDDDVDSEEDVSRKVGRKNGKGKGRYVESENPKVMLISLKAGALGLNLTVANNVYLMDPWWQEGIESQAVDRVNRIGQKKPVHVYQLIAENTVESKVLEIQERKKQLIQQAFSGIKRTETQRQQRHARLQDLIELFGIRAQTASQLG